jgi:hypothetical protein
MSTRTRTPGRVRAGRENVKAAQAAKAEAAAILAQPPALVTTPVQDKLIAAALSGHYKIIGFGGGVRATKTFGSLILLVLLCRIFPRSRWAIIRQSLPRLKKTTMPSFNKLRGMAPGFIGEINKSEYISTCANGSEIVFFPESIQEDKELERFSGLEVNGFLFEEANEMDVRTYEKSKERAGAWVIPSTKDDPTPGEPPALIICTFNPCDNWPRNVFYEPYKAGTMAPPYLFIPASQADNPYVPKEEREMWALMPPDEYKKYIEGDWTRIISPNQLILFEWLEQAAMVDRTGFVVQEAVDVAWMGDDSTVFARMAGNALVEITGDDKLTIDETASIAAKRIVSRWIEHVQYRVDAVGSGAGVYDLLHKAGFNVTAFQAGAKPVDRRLDDKRDKQGKRSPESMFQFANLRSQAWWEFREKLRLGMLRIGNPPETPQDEWEAVTHPLLVADLLAPRYEITGDKVISVENKKSIKTRLGRSTDYGDAVVMAAFDLPKTLPRVFTPAEYAKSYVKW